MSEYTERDHALRDIDIYAKTKYEITLRWLRDVPRDSLLFNIGCGAGIFNEMAVDAGFVVQGFEPDPAAFRLAEQHLPSEGCHLFPYGLEGIAPNSSARVVVMHDVLEHLEDDATAVAHMRNIVAHDGRIVVSVPAIPALFGLHDEQLGHFRRYTRSTLRRVLEPHFRITRLRAFGCAFIPLTAYFSRWRRKPYPLEQAAGTNIGAGVVRGACAFERTVPLPIGTSLICEAFPGPTS